MTLTSAKINTLCVIKALNITDTKTKLRLMELGINIGGKIVVKNKSILKKTLLVIVNGTCFTITSIFADGVVVEYA